MMTARGKYESLIGDRDQFLSVARECSRLTLPYLIKQDDDNSQHKTLVTPWQAVGAKAVTNLSSKLMLALLPPQTSFFKLQVNDAKLGEMFNPEVKSELELSFSKIERMIMEHINASSDRVVVHQALKHLIVGGNSLIYMGKKGLKSFPLNRYVIERDGDGNVVSIVTKELISRRVLGKDLPLPEVKPNEVGDGKGGLGISSGSTNDDVPVYTYVKMEEQSGRWIWHQEVFDKIIPGSRSTAPKNASPWLPLRFNTVDGEAYGRGRVEEFLGDLRSLEALSQALVEGSAAAAKVVFVVSPSSTTKPQTLAKAGNGAIVQGRPDDIGVVQVGKTADFSTAAQMADQLVQRINDGFLVLQIRQSERTTAEEVRLTQLDLEQGLGGLFSLLTVEFLVPYLNRTMLVLQRNKQLPPLPKNLVSPTIVAGVNALGRGQDAQSLTQFITTIAQTMGPEAIMKYIDPGEYVKRLAAAQGIDVLNLVKTQEQLQGEMEDEQQMAQQQSLVDQVGQLASSPLADPTKNTQLQEQLSGDEAPAEEAGPPQAG